MSRILLIANDIPFPPHRDGGCSTLYNFISCWKAAGNEVKVFYLSSQEIEYEKRLNELFQVECTAANIIGREIIGKLSGKKLLKPRNCWHIQARKCQEIDATGVDYVVLGSLVTGLVKDKIKNFSGKLIFFEADSISMFYQRNMKQTKNIIRKTYLKAQYKCVSSLESMIYKFSDDVVFVSDVDREYTENKTTGHFSTNRIAVSIPENAQKTVHQIEKGDIVHIGFSGIMDYEPNMKAVDYIIEKIMPLLDSSGMNYRMHIIGKNPQERWKQHAYVTNEKLIITGFLDDIETYIASMDIYISPLFLGSGMKNKILQAMGLGVPMICSNVSIEGISELNDEKNVLIVSEHANEWLEAIEKLSYDYSMQYKFSEECKKIIVDKYSWKNSAMRLLEG